MLIPSRSASAPFIRRGFAAPLGAATPPLRGAGEPRCSNSFASSNVLVSTEFPFNLRAGRFMSRAPVSCWQPPFSFLSLVLCVQSVQSGAMPNLKVGDRVQRIGPPQGSRYGTVTVVVRTETEGRGITKYEVDFTLYRAILDETQLELVRAAAK